MALQICNISINRNTAPPTAQVQLQDEDGCIVSVKVTLQGKSVDAFTVGELNMLGLVAAKHLINQT